MLNMMPLSRHMLSLQTRLHRWFILGTIILPTLAVLAPKWISAVDDIEEDLLRDDSNELKVMIVHVDIIKSDLSWLHKPWLLKGKATNEYWHCIFNRWMEHKEKKHAGISILPEPEMS